MLPSNPEDRAFWPALGFATYEPSFDALTDYIEASPTFAAMNAHGAFSDEPAVSAVVAYGRRLGIILAVLERAGERIALAVA